jgi:putative addiction module CopG family antidote
MPIQLPPELETLVRNRMATGNYESEEDLIRRALVALENEEDDLRAVEQAIREWHEGDAGIPIDDAFAAVRARHAISLEP